MTSGGGADASQGGSPGPAPSLVRRMACFVYEATLLFGVALIPAIVGTWFFAQTGQSHPLQSEIAVQAFAFVLYAIYFVGFWSARGQTLAMQTWHIRVVDADGGRLSQARALLRYLACCLAWFAPALLLASLAHLPPWPKLAAIALGIVIYALLALAAPGRQFWHDIACGTRLVDSRGATPPGRLRPRPR
ncbi:MAG: RDD family protein [Caldimonas sp.]